LKRFAFEVVYRQLHFSGDVFYRDCGNVRLPVGTKCDICGALFLMVAVAVVCSV